MLAQNQKSREERHREVVKLRQADNLLRQEQNSLLANFLGGGGGGVAKKKTKLINIFAEGKVFGRPLEVEGTMQSIIQATLDYLGGQALTTDIAGALKKTGDQGRLIEVSQDIHLQSSSSDEMTAEVAVSIEQFDEKHYIVYKF